MNENFINDKSLLFCYSCSNKLIRKLRTASSHSHPTPEEQNERNIADFSDGLIDHIAYILKFKLLLGTQLYTKIHFSIAQNSGVMS